MSLPVYSFCWLFSPIIGMGLCFTACVMKCSVWGGDKGETCGCLHEYFPQHCCVELHCPQPLCQIRTSNHKRSQHLRCPLLLLQLTRHQNRSCRAENDKEMFKAEGRLSVHRVENGQMCCLSGTLKCLPWGS